MIISLDCELPDDPDTSEAYEVLRERIDALRRKEIQRIKAEVKAKLKDKPELRSKIKEGGQQVES